jgi:hypothetical protein
MRVCYVRKIYLRRPHKATAIKADKGVGAAWRACKYARGF